MVAGEGIPGVLDGGLDPVLALADGDVREAYRGKKREAGRKINLDTDGMGLDADDGAAEGLDDHADLPFGVLPVLNAPLTFDPVGCTILNEMELSNKWFLLPVYFLLTSKFVLNMVFTGLIAVVNQGIPDS